MSDNAGHGREDSTGRDGGARGDDPGQARPGYDAAGTDATRSIDREQARPGGDDAPGGAHTPHPGWARQPRENYESGDSGGWGGPDARHHTGPLPRLRTDRDGGHGAAEHPARPGRTPDERVAYADPTGHDAGGPYGDPAAPSPHPDAAHHPGHDHRSAHDHEPAYDHEPTYGPGPGYGPGHGYAPGQGYGQADGRGYGPGAGGAPRGGVAAAAGGAGALFDLTFRRTATFTIVPFTYVVVLVFLLLDYMRSIYEYSTAAGTLGAGTLGGLLILFVVGLFKVVVLAAITRLALELCLHVAETARARRR